MPISNYLGVNHVPPAVETNRYQDIKQQAKVKNNVSRAQDINTINNSSTDFNSLLNKKLNNQLSKLPSINKNYQDISKQATKVKNNSLSRLQDIATKNTSAADSNSLLNKKLNDQSLQLRGINKQKIPSANEDGTNIALKENMVLEELSRKLGNEFMAALWQIMFETGGVEGYTNGVGEVMFQQELVRSMVADNSGEMGDIARSIYEQVKIKE